MTVAVYLLSTTITTILVHAESKAERTLAMDAVMNQLEVMHSRPFQELFALYNPNPDDDPDGPGTAPGRHFAVDGLDPTAGDADGFVGRVILPVQSGKLRESVEMEELSMPRDLNGDLKIDDQNHAGDYIVLPVTVRVEWKGRGGDRSFEMSTMLANLAKVRS